MRKILNIGSLFIFILFISSCQDMNSNTSDKTVYGPVVFDESDPNFEKAYYIVQNRCTNCHTSYHNKWAANTSNADWIAEGIIVPGNPASSIFIQRIINSGLGGASNMPLNGAQLPVEEYQHLVKWVQEMQ